MSALRKNVASQVITFCLVDSSTGAAKTGATVTTKVALDGTQSASAGTLTELTTGQYKYVPTQGETNGTSVGFLFTATGAVPVNIHCFTIGQDPTQATFDANTTKVGGTTQTARDLGASVLLSPGTGTGQLDIASGVTKANATQFAGQTITAAAGVTIPSSIASPTNITAATGVALSAAGVQAIWDALTSALTTVGSIGKRIVDNLDAAITSRLASASYTTPPTAAANATAVRSELTTELARIDAAVSSRSTYAGADTAGTTTLLSRIASALTITTGKVDVNDKTGFSLSAGGVQAIWDALTSALTAVGSIGKLIVDRLDAAISSRLASASYTAPPSAATNASQVRTELTVELARIDAAITTRLASAGYTAPPSAAANASATRTELAAELAHITLAKKLLKNRTETNPATGIMTVYDDDGTTPLYTASVYEDVAGATAYDGTAGVNRRNALA